MLVYLDNSATTRAYDEVIALMNQMQKEEYGNPSSLHTMGLAAEKRLRAARRSLALALCAREEEVYFTSGGTESDNTVLAGLLALAAHGKNRLITTAVEHPAVLEPARRLESLGFKVDYIGVDRHCHLNMQQLEAALGEDVAMISVMTVNNETGTIMPLAEIGRLKERFNREHGTAILLHTDAVQALGKLPLDMAGALRQVDMLSVSAHKIHGPKGVGGLYVRKGTKAQPFMLGGGQERAFRSGTENTPGICGFGLALDMATGRLSEHTAAMQKARAALLSALKAEVPDIVINSPEDETASLAVLNVSFLGTRGEVLLHTLEQEGIFVSTGSACSSHKKGQSHVLTAMGLKPKEIEGAIRFSFSEFNSPEQMEYTAQKVKEAVARFRRLGSFR